MVNVDSIQKQVSTESREMEILRKNQKEMLEIRNTVNEMKNAFEELISGIGAVEERISEFEDIS